MTHLRSHSWQAARGRPTLDPAKLPIEGRGETDLVAYLAELAALFQFFGGDKKGPENWQDVLDNDPVFLMAQIATHLEKRPYYENRGAKQDAQQAQISNLCVQILDWSDRLDKWSATNSGLQSAFEELRAMAFTAPDENLFQSAAPPLTAQELATKFVSPLDRLVRGLGKEAQDILEEALTQRSDLPPHIGLLLGFLSMREKTRSHVNQLTGRHLDYFYRDVLRLRPREADYDTAMLTIALIPDAKPLELPSGTIFEAGRNDNGEPIHYRTTDPARIDHARVSQVLTLNYVRRAGKITDVRRGAAEVPLAAPFSAFGAANGGSPARFGLAVVSKLLLLPAGHRRISAKLKLSGDVSTLKEYFAKFDEPVAASLFGLDVTAFGEEGPLTPRSVMLTPAVDALRDFSLRVDMELPADAPGLIETSAPSEAARGGRIDIALVKCPGGHGAELFKAVEITAVALSIHVTGLPLLSATTPDGDVDTTAPVALFGAQPMPGARFSFCLPPLHVRPKQAHVTLNWMALPEVKGGVREHYAGYGLEEDFTACADFRASSGWTKGNAKQPLFPQPTIPTSDRSSFTLPVGEAPEGAHFALRFSGPPEGFAHRIYQQKLTEAAIEKASASMAKHAFDSTMDMGKKLVGVEVEPPVEDLNPPVTPMIDALTLEYMAETTLNRATSPEDGALEALGPFGHSLAQGSAQFSLTRVVGPTDDEPLAALFLCLESSEPGKLITLFADVADDARTVYHPADRTAPNPVHWRYRSTSGWRSLPAEALRYDETQGLKNKGRIAIRLPRDATNYAPDMPGPGHWIAIQPLDAQTVTTTGKLRSIAAQAVEVTRANAAPWINAPPGSIRRLIDKTTAPLVQSVTQPVAGYGGRAPEAVSRFRARVSERLRHKARIVQPRDAEQIALDAFDDLGDAKAVRVGPGDMALCVVGRRSTEDPLPRIGSSRLRDIFNQLSPRMPAGMVLTVRNASFEPVRMRCWMRYAADASPTDLNSLTADLNNWIAPWMANLTAACPIGTGSVEPGALEAFLEGLNAVDYVTGVTLTRLSRTGGPEEGRGLSAYHDFEQAALIEGSNAHRALRPGTPFSVLVPADEHLAYGLNPPFEIGHMRVGTSFFTRRTDAARNDNMHVGASTVGIGGLRVGQELIPRDPMRPNQESH